MYKLTEKDRQSLKYQCRPGIILPFLLLALTPLISTFVILASQKELSAHIPIIATLAAFPFALLIGFFMMHKYIIDLRGNSKRGTIKRISRKQSKEEFESENGTGFRGIKHVAFDDYALIIDNTRYGVDQKLYEKCNNGDEVIFFTAPLSKFHLGIELHETYD